MDRLIRRVLLGPVVHSAALLADRSLRWFHSICQNCRQTQDKRLFQAVKGGSGSDFGRKHGLGKVRSYEDFKAALPIAQWPYFAPYVDRCKEGDARALFGPSDSLVMFASTSGTTGPAKAIPVTKRSMLAYKRGWTIWGIKMIRDHPGPLVRSVLQISSPMQEDITPSGLPIGSISGLLARNQNPVARSLYASPYEVADIPDPDLRYYAIMRFAIPRDVALIVTANPSTLVMLAKVADRHVEDIIRDIRDGTLRVARELHPETRGLLTGRLRPDPGCAKRLEQILNTFGSLYPRFFWNKPLLAHWTGGTADLYLDQVCRYYGDGPIRDIGLLASEARMSIPIQDNTPSGVLDIASAFFEFIPEEEVNRLDLPVDAETLPSSLTVLRAEELEIGCRYYIVITNGAGLYRYHIGDVVQVTGWMGTTPMIEFLSRGINTSSITGEKLTEYQVTRAVGSAIASLGLERSCFVMYPVWADPPYYMLLIEGLPSISQDQQQVLSKAVDANLVAANCEYASKRKSCRLGAVRTRFLTDGELSVLDRQLILANKGRSEQFKHRCLLNQPLNTDLTGLGIRR